MMIDLPVLLTVAAGLVTLGGVVMHVGARNRVVDELKEKHSDLAKESRDRIAKAEGEIGALNQRTAQHGATLDGVRETVMKMDGKIDMLLSQRRGHE